MLGTIILREMQEYIKSKRLQIGLLAIILLISVTTVINLGAYSRRAQEYLDAEREMRYTGEVRLYKPPQVIGILVRSREDKLGVAARVMPRTISPFTDRHYLEVTDNRADSPAFFSAVDFSFIIKVFMSLLVIFLAFNSVAEEKEQGTLRLSLSNSVPRHILLTGKMLGGMGVISILLMVSFLLSTALMVIHPAVSLGHGDFVRILLIYGVSLLYLTVFLGAGTFISAVVNHRSTALLILLQFWLIAAVIYPHVGILSADKLKPLPTLAQWMESRKETLRPYEEESQKAGKALADDLLVNQQIDRWHAYLKKDQSRVEALYGLQREYLNLQKNQAETAWNISILSPSVSFERAVEVLARTGMAEHDRFLDQVVQYWKSHLPAEREIEILEIIRDGKILRYLPQFRYPKSSIAEDAPYVFPSILLLALSSAVFCSLAYVVFLRKDVR
ncbi:MAG: ABC transporter permease [Candidatus Latescibacterota bacterium]